MLNRFKGYITKSYLNRSVIEAKRANALFYYACSGFIIYPAICITMAFLAPNEIVFGVTNSTIVLIFIGLTLWLIKQDRYHIAANLFNAVILVSVLSTVFIRSYQNPVVYFSTFELMLIVIVQASLFCSRKWVIFYSVVTIICDVIFYQILKTQVGSDSSNTLLTGAFYVAVSIILVTFISQLSIAIFKSAINQIEFELQRNREYLDTIENLHSTSQKLKHQFDQAKEVSLRDELTGLKNRRYITEVIEDEIGAFLNQKIKTMKYGKNLRNNSLGFYGIYFADLDHFKRINDTYGHDAGDLVLKQLSELFLTITRENDAVIRWGGEEFLILLKNTKSQYLIQFAEKLGRKVKEYDFAISSKKTVKLTCSIGFTNLPLDNNHPDYLTLNDAITLADQALYHSKKNGRNRWTGIQSTDRQITTKDIPYISQSLIEAAEKGLIQVTDRKIA
ncbi:MAG: diguanylate cyclase [Proteobacteria bacterium]|nr:diguanylate cyclase [Pseudomonadota bacterium]